MLHSHRLAEITCRYKHFQYLTLDNPSHGEDLIQVLYQLPEHILQTELSTEIKVLNMASDFILEELC